MCPCDRLIFRKEQSFASKKAEELIGTYPDAAPEVMAR